MVETYSLEVMRTLVQESLEAPIPQPVRRDIDPRLLHRHNVFSVIGPRRAGKRTIRNPLRIPPATKL